MILDLLFGNRIFLIDKDLGKFFTEKKLFHSEPINWKRSQKIFHNKQACELELQGDKSEIYPAVKKEYLYFLSHFKEDVKPKLDEAIKEKRDLLSFDRFQYEFFEMKGRKEGENGVLHCACKETEHSIFVRFVIVNHELKSASIL